MCEGLEVGLQCLCLLDLAHFTVTLHRSAGELLISIEMVPEVHQPEPKPALASAGTQTGDPHQMEPNPADAATRISANPTNLPP